jgi:hypothetical protein
VVSESVFIMSSKNEHGLSELNKNGNKTGKLREPGKHNECKAAIQVSISTP